MISSNEISSLQDMYIENIHYDANYDKFLLIHLSKKEPNGTLSHKALLYDRPMQSNGDKFIGHLIGTFMDEHIEAILTVDDLLIIVNRTEAGVAHLNEYEVTDYYSVQKKRIYPLYGRKIVENGDHVSDGRFIYIEVSLKDDPAHKSEYLVFHPAFSTTNILTHKFIKSSPLSFAQQVKGVGSSSTYPNTLGIHGHHLFSLTTPNAVIEFESKSQTYKKGSKGIIELALVDYRNTMH